MPVKIFFCYAHEDEVLLNKFKAHLKPLIRQGLIDIWYDRDIGAGTEWEQEIDKNLNAANIILLMVSPYFVSSDYCYSIEMKRAMERHESGEALVIPIILRHIDWEGVPFNKLQTLPRDFKPVSSRVWRNKDEAFAVIAQGIRKTISTLSNEPTTENEDATNIQFLGIEQKNLDTSIVERNLITLESLEEKELPTVIMHRRLLYIKKGEEVGQQFVVEGPLSIGRQRNNEIFLVDKGASRRHALIYLDIDKKCIIKDIGSSNGTIVNGRILRSDETYILKPGSEILIGETIIVYNEE